MNKTILSAPPFKKKAFFDSMWPCFVLIFVVITQIWMRVTGAPPQPFIPLIQVTQRPTGPRFYLMKWTQKAA